MSVRDSFNNYTDGNWLNTPEPGVWSRKHPGSDNGPMFTSEVYIVLKKNGELNFQDKIDYNLRIGQCIDKNGLLNRVPIGQQDGLESVDDHYGVLNGCYELGNTSIPRKILKATIKYLGFLNNVNPGKRTWQSFLVRQPQLVAAMVAASFPSLKNPLHWLARLIAFPFFIAAAISIAISCINTPTDQADPRRLAWHLQNNCKKVSFLCRIASKIWMKRLRKDYGIPMMSAVAAIYYEPKGIDQNPYSKYWITD